MKNSNMPSSPKKSLCHCSPLPMSMNSIVSQSEKSTSFLIKYFIPFSIEKTTVEIWLGYFLAPTTGSYRFFLSNDDGAELLLSSVANSPDYQYLQKIAYDYTYNAYAIPYFSVPYSKESQTSQKIDLQANDYYLISAIRRQGGGQSHMMVGVEVPNDEWTVQSMARLVRIDVKYGSVKREIMKVDITGFKKIGQFKFALEARSTAG